MDLSESKKTRWLICLGLALATAGLYARVAGFGFVVLDDEQYVTQNSMVRAGLTLKSVQWAFTHVYASNWHPLTWISHMLDCQVFGLHAGGPHLVNVALHAANAVLLFVLLQRMTGAQWRSAMVAALFALHPMHAESVAWIAERKDVLSTFFALLSLLAYVRYVKESNVHSPQPKIWYALTLALFVLGLLAKPMLVTLPFVMLLLDFWPLRRFDFFGLRTGTTDASMTEGGTYPATSKSGKGGNVKRLLLEKAPFFLLSAASSVITVYAQKSGGSVVAMSILPFRQRVFMAIESYVWYVGKSLWPNHLAVFYPMEKQRAVMPFICACVFLLITTMAAVRMAKRRPFFLMGWLWYLGTLVPVIGLVQVGMQEAADRYSYVPSIGLFIIAVWWGYELAGSSRLKLIAGSCAMAIVVVALSAATYVQVGYWKDSFTLFRHAIAVTRDNDTAFLALGAAFFEEGRYGEALKAYNAVKQDPQNPLYQNDLGAALAASGKKAEALEHYAEAARLEPDNGQYQDNLGTALARSGQEEAAIEHYQMAIRDDPNYADAYSNLGALEMSQHRVEEAERDYSEAVALKPTNGVIYLNAGIVFLKLRHIDEAEKALAEAVRIDSGSGDAHYEYGHALFLAGQVERAREELNRAVQMKPDNASGQFYLGLACVELNLVEEGIQHLEGAAQLRPNWAEPLNAEAWVLATSENDQARNGAKAVQLAERAAEMTSRRQPVVLNTLAAAYAETGQFSNAIATANEAKQLAQQLSQTDLAGKIQQALACYNSGQPYREKNRGDK